MKFIIHNLSELSDITAMELITSVVKSGKISGMYDDKYCYLTIFTIGDKEYVVSADTKCNGNCTFKIFRHGEYKNVKK